MIISGEDKVAALAVMPCSNCGHELCLHKVVCDQPGEEFAYSLGPCRLCDCLQGKFDVRFNPEEETHAN